MLCSISTTLFAQQRMVKGTVVDEQGESLIGVSVTVKNAQKGTITDVNGEFSLQLPAEKTLLVFTYIGYETVAVNAANQKSIQVKMKSSSHEMDEVVVVGYGSIRKSDLTGSVASVNVADTEIFSSTNSIIPTMFITSIIQIRLLLLEKRALQLFNLI